jgi:hypothetical protein
MTTKLPAITASLLAEYCFATAPRRRAILEQMHGDKFEPFKLWYGEVPGAYRQFLASQGGDYETLDSLDAQLILRRARSDQEDDKALLQIDALEHIRHIDHSKLLSHALAVLFDHKVRVLQVAGVSIRVHPTNMLVAQRLGHTEQAIGVIKPLLRKSKHLSTEEGRVFAVLLHWFTEIELSHLGVANTGLSAVCDVFARKLHFAPDKNTKVRSTIEANCQEIADRWASFTPRVDSKKLAKTK